MLKKKNQNCLAPSGNPVYADVEPSLSNSLRTTVEPETEPLHLRLAFASARILVVDDDKDNRDVIATYLTLGGYNVTSASTAQEAIHISNTQSFDAYVLDRRLPDLDGIELCRHLCACDGEAVLIFSAAARPIDIEQGLEAGAQAYLTKPEGFYLLLEIVERLIKIKELRKVSSILTVGTRLMNTPITSDNCEVTPETSEGILERLAHGY